MYSCGPLSRSQQLILFGRPKNFERSNSRIWFIVILKNLRKIVNLCMKMPPSNMLLRHFISLCFNNLWILLHDPNHSSSLKDKKCFWVKYESLIHHKFSENHDELQNSKYVFFFYIYFVGPKSRSKTFIIFRGLKIAWEVKCHVLIQENRTTISISDLWDL